MGVAVKARKLLFLVFLLALGASVETAWRIRTHVEFGPLGWRVLGGRFYGPSFTFEEDKVEGIPAGGTVAVTNEFGGVKVSRGEGKDVRVHLRKVLYVPTESAARALADRVKLASDVDGQVLRLSTNRSELEREGVFADVGLETHLEVTVPAGVGVNVKNDHGRIDVADVARADVDGSFEPITVERVEGDANVQGRHGDIQVSSVGGSLTLQGRHGDVDVRDAAGRASLDVEHADTVKVERVGGLALTVKHGDVEATTVRGDVEIKGERSSVKLTGVTGAARVETTFDDVHVSDVGGDAHIKTEHGAIDASRIKGAVRAEASFDGITLAEIGGHADAKVDHGGVSARDLASGATIVAAGDDVTVERFHGSVRIESSRGGVRAVPGGPLTEPLWVKADHGTITVQVPAASRFDLTASARPGNVDVSLADFTPTERSASKASGRVGGGGAAVVLDTEHGDVTVEPREVEADAKEN
jgi:Putative adhesin